MNWQLIVESQWNTEILSLYFLILTMCLKQEALLVLDEIDNDIHPTLMPEIIGWFHDERTNLHNAQLIMACHNASLLEHLPKKRKSISPRNLLTAGPRFMG